MKQANMKLFQLIGGEEGSGAIDDMWAMHNVFTDLGFSENELFSIEVENGQHNEAFWKEQFADAYLWMYTSFANDINEIIRSVEMEITPNPAKNYITLDSNKFGNNDSLEIIDMRGRKIMNLNIGDNGKVDVKGLNPGSYILIIKTKERTYYGKFIKI